MVFNDLSSTKQGIVPDIYFMLFGESTDHSADFSLADLTRLVNRWYDKVVIKILQSDTRWEWDDTNKTDLPIANITLVSGQQDYGITAATYLKVLRVDIKDSNGNSINLIPFDLDKIKGTAEAEFRKTAGTPKYYRLLGSSIFLYPKPNYGYTNGLRIFYQRNVDYFVSTDTTKTPGFAEMFHRILSLGASYDFALVNGLNNKAASFLNEIGVKVPGTEKMTGLMGSLEDFYASRSVDEKQKLTLARTDYGESSLGNQGRGFSHPDRFFF